MALQFLPILLIGGGAAVVYTKQKEKKRKRSGAGCAPENTVTVGEMATVAAQVDAKFGDKKEPFSAASYAIKALLPNGCNRNSKNSRIKVQISENGKAADFDVSVPDFYMLILSNSISQRFERGKITKEELRKYEAQGLEWYKKATGKNFDPATLGLEKLIQALGKAMLEAIEGAVKGGKKEVKPARCPAEVDVDVDGHRQEMAQFLGEQFSRGEKDTFGLADQVFARIVLAPCTKRDFTTMANVLLDGEMRRFDLAAVYASIVMDIMQEQHRRNLITATEAMNVAGQVVDNYKRLTGHNLPANLA